MTGENNKILLLASIKNKEKENLCYLQRQLYRLHKNNAVISTKISLAPA